MRISGIVEGVAVTPEKGLVDVHARAIDSIDGLGHECGVHVMSSGYLLYNQLCGHHAVGHGDGVSVLKATSHLSEEAVAWFEETAP